MTVFRALDIVAKLDILEYIIFDYGDPKMTIDSEDAFWHTFLTGRLIPFR